MLAVRASAYTAAMRWIFALVLSLCTFLGISPAPLQADGAPPSGNPEPAPHTFLLHLNGIGGKRIMDRWLLEGLAQGGLEASYRIYDWTGDEEGMLALADVKLHQTESAKVAAMLADYHRDHPADRIILTSHSAGAGIAAWALSQLPAGTNIDTWLMLEPALSPQFDLSAALSHVNGRAYVFSSINDGIVLSAGTRLMGTVDRVQTDAAGFSGFVRPPQGDVRQYQKLISVPYDTAWLRLGNFGDHIGCMMRPFARAVIAPILIDGVIPKLPPITPTPSPTISTPPAAP